MVRIRKLPNPKMLAVTATISGLTCLFLSFGYPYSIHYKSQKLFLLFLSLFFSSAAIIVIDKYDDAGQTEIYIRRSTDRTLLLSHIRQKWAMLSPEQQQRFLAELTRPANTSPIKDAGRFIEATYRLEQGEPIDAVVTQIWKVEIGTGEHVMVKREFEKWLKP